MGLQSSIPGSIERTSFAERLERKGFYIIHIDQGQFKWEFRELPTRPMAEIILDVKIIDKKMLIDRLTAMVSTLAPDSIIRVKCTNDEQLSVLNAGELRAIFPKSFNVELSLPHRRATIHQGLN